MAQKKVSNVFLVLLLLSTYKFRSISTEDNADLVNEQTGYNNHTNTSICPTWFIFKNITELCECGDDLDGIVTCDGKQKKVYVINCYCMTQDNLIGTAVGTCSTNCFIGKSDHSFEMYYQLPTNLNELNEAMCKDRWNRSGRLCGKCKDGYYPLVYSYDMRCTECTDSNYNWLKFVVAAFAPLTIFFLFVVSCGISASSPQLGAFVVFAQTIATPSNVRMVLEAIRVYTTTAILCRIVATLYGIWNLDFFRTLLPPVCLKVSTLQALALDYLIAIYPLILIIMTYILIDLYDRHLCLLIWMWKPFKMCLKSFTSNINIKSAIINAFGTFLLLSYVKLLSVSFDLLIFTRTYGPNGESLGYFLYYDASIEYFGKEHLPYGILAIMVLIVFIAFPPLFGLLHPLTCLRGYIGKWPALRYCLDSYQGYFKDGTEGTRDCRCFLSLYLFARIALFVVYGFIKNVYFYPFASILLLIPVALLILVQPFKPQFGVYNTIHALLFLNLSMWFVTVTCITTSSLKVFYLKKFSFALSAIVAILPLLYITCLALKWLYSQRLVKKYFVKYCACCYYFRKLKDADQDRDADSIDSIPYRMEHPDEEQLIQSKIINVDSTEYGTIRY